MTHHFCIHCVPSFWKQAMNINDASTTSAISHVPAFRMNLTKFQGILGVMRRMRNISLLCCPKQKRKNQPITMLGIEHCDWFILPLMLPTPTMEFSLDHKRRTHKRNRCSASDFDSLIFTRSYQITTPTPSLVKTSLKCLKP